MKWLHIPALLVLLYPACQSFTASSATDAGGASEAGASGEPSASGEAGANAQAGASDESNVSGASGAGGAGNPNGGDSAGGEPGSDAGSAGEVGGAGTAGSGGSSGSASGGMSGGGACQMSVCDAGQVQSASQACGACNTGKQTRTRTCSSDRCSWGPWSAWSACAGVSAACSPGKTSACTNGDSCGQRVCSDACTWGSCTPKVAGGCLRIRAGHTDEGSNYRCCGSAGHWQFCNSSCQWNTTCASCAKGAPDYCTECY